MAAALFTAVFFAAPFFFFTFSSKAVILSGAFFALLYATYKRNPLSFMKPALAALLYFIPIFLLKAFSNGGELLVFLNIGINVEGLRETGLYFLRILGYIYFLNFYLSMAKYVPLPNNRIGDELGRLLIFLLLMRKYSGKEIGMLSKEKVSLAGIKQLPRRAAAMINSVYTKVFRHFPYRRPLRSFRAL